MKWILSLIFIVCLYSCDKDTPNIPPESVGFRAYFISTTDERNLMKNIPIDTIYKYGQDKDIIRLDKSICKVKVYFNNQYNEIATYNQQTHLYVDKDTLGNNFILFNTSIPQDDFKNSFFKINTLMQCSYIFNDTLYHDISATCRKSEYSSNLISVSLDGKDGELSDSQFVAKFLVD